MNNKEITNNIPQIQQPSDIVSQINSSMELIKNPEVVKEVKSIRGTKMHQTIREDY